MYVTFYTLIISLLVKKMYNISLKKPSTNLLKDWYTHNLNPHLLYVFQKPRNMNQSKRILETIILIWCLVPVAIGADKIGSSIINTLNQVQ